MAMEMKMKTEMDDSDTLQPWLLWPLSLLVLLIIRLLRAILFNRQPVTLSGCR